VFFAYSVVTHDEALLFIDDKQLSDETRKHLGAHVTIKPYTEFFEYLKGLNQKLGLSKDTVSGVKWISRMSADRILQPVIIADKASFAIASAIGQVSLLPRGSAPSLRTHLNLVLYFIYSRKK
jgi:Xaa-Pro aminopeptidase